ncbi:MAG: aldose 1-epimerase [Acidimicrobiia bacterium]
MIELSAGDATASVDDRCGGRVASLRVDGVELLVTEGDGTFRWGIFPMVPFAGRIRDGRFDFDGVGHQLPRVLEGHALHGTVFERVWDAIGDATLRTDLGEVWPFAGSVEHAVDLRPDSLRLHLRLRATEKMPVTIGWHPWFRRDLGRGSPANLAVTADAMYERDAKLPTGNLVEPSPPPWDDCFTGVRWPVVLRWPGFATLEISSDCTHVVVYDEEEGAICVEPQTGPPDAVNLGEAAVVESGGEIVAAMTLRWSMEG